MSEASAKKGTKGFAARPLAERFWEKVNKTETCWLWAGCGDGRGYGTIGVKGRTRRAHRIAWELENGPIPEGMSVCHKCDNPPCVNPAHLFLGTHRENMLDAFAKGRISTPVARGLPPWNANLTHCKRGHEFTEENTVRIPRGGRACRTCQKAYFKGRRQIRKPRRKAPEGTK